MTLHRADLQDFEINAVLAVLVSPEASALVRTGEDKIAVGRAIVALGSAQPYAEPDPEPASPPQAAAEEKELALARVAAEAEKRFPNEPPTDGTHPGLEDPPNAEQFAD